MKALVAAVLMISIGALAGPSVLTPPAGAVAAVPAATTDACGMQPLKPDGTPWRCTFVDDFSGTSLDRSKWLPQTSFSSGTGSGTACYVDSPQTVAVNSGTLRLIVRKLWSSVSCTAGGTTFRTRYVAGMVSTYHLFSQQYGRFEARVKNTATTYPGLQESFWLWPDDRVPSADIWPTAGEIDISETYSQYWWLSVPFLHYSADAQGTLLGTNTAWDCYAQRGVWNTYVLEWSASRLEIFVNGKSCLVNTSGDRAFQKPYIIAFTAALGIHGNAYAGRAPLPATMSVDHIRAWE